MKSDVHGSAIGRPVPRSFVDRPMELQPPQPVVLWQTQPMTRQYAKTVGVQKFQGDKE